MQSNGHTDSRRWEREQVAIPVGLVLKADELNSEIRTATINMSLSGAGILTELTLVPKQELEIVIKGEFSRSLSARVVWVRKHESSSGTIAGLKFLLYKIAMAS